MFGWNRNLIEPQTPEVNDPRLNALLNEALAPEDVPVGLDRAIVALTREDLSRWQSGVLARLNQYSWPRALAASVIIGSMVGISYLTISVIHDARTNVQTMAMIRQDLNALPAYQPPLAPTGPQIAEVRAEATQLHSDLDEIQNSLSQAFPEPDSLDDDDAAPAVF